ncbi:MAG TPA: chorismate mutase [Alphaproteobacteria bacterium]|nr:chorismate mutase [Alphaproteobacteria bacterium]
MKILEPYRQRIDALDDKLVDLLVERAKIIAEVAEIKAENNIPAVLQDRVDEVRERAVKRAVEQGADEHYMREIYTTIIRLSCEMEENHKS